MQEDEKILYVQRKCGGKKRGCVISVHTLSTRWLWSSVSLRYLMKYRSWDVTYIPVFSGVSLSWRGAYFTAFKEDFFFFFKPNPSLSHHYSQSLPPSLNLPQKIIYVVWLPHCQRSKLIRCITHHARFSRGSCGFIRRERSRSHSSLIVVC